MGRIPNTESKASWQIKQKAAAPESAVLHASLYAQPTNAVSRANAQEDWLIRTARRGFQEGYETGRKPGSRIVWDEVREIYTVEGGENNEGNNRYYVSGEAELSSLRSRAGSK